MDLNNIFQDMKNSGDSIQATKMSAYMRNQFLFLGIPTPRRKEFFKKYFKTAKEGKRIDWDFINTCWQEPYREFQYAAISYLTLLQQYLTSYDIPKIRKLALEKPWWDTIDGLDKIIGYIAYIYPEVNDTLLAWSKDDNIWLRRIAIDHQLTRKDKTDTALLEEIIVNNLGQSEFFINKAIGWSLREYSKTNSGWVRDFIKKYQDDLAPLSIKEAGKYI